MQYGQVILFIVFCFAIYYIVMILMDLQKANAAKQAEAENNKEEDIDISDEAKQFCPVKITREVKPKQAEAQTEEKTDGQDTEQKTSKGEDVKEAKAANNDNDTENVKKAVNNENKPEKAADEKSQNHPQPKPDAQKANSQSSESKQDEKPSEDEEQKPRRILRKAIMTDGIEVEKLAELADAGLLEEKLGPIVRGCENAMTNIE